MNWKEELAQKLVHRETRDRKHEKFQSLQTRYLNPALNEFKKVLYEYQIECDVNSNDSSIVIKWGGYDVMKMIFKAKSNDEILLETVYFSTPPDAMNPEKEIDTEGQAKEDVLFKSRLSVDSIGELFVRNFDQIEHFKE